MIEVLVAFVILSMTTAVVYRTFSASLVGAGRAADHGRAVLLAQSLLAAAGSEYPLETGATEGRDGPFGWLIEISGYPPREDGEEEPENGAPKARQVTVTISWRDGHADHSLELTTLRLSP